MLKPKRNDDTSSIQFLLKNFKTLEKIEQEIKKINFIFFLY